METTENTSNINNNWPYHGSKLIPKEELKPFLKRDNQVVLNFFAHFAHNYIWRAYIFIT